jgi:hypothetical protein
VAAVANAATDYGAAGCQGEGTLQVWQRSPGLGADAELIGAIAPVFRLSEAPARTPSVR